MNYHAVKGVVSLRVSSFGGIHPRPKERGILFAKIKPVVLSLGLAYLSPFLFWKFRDIFVERPEFLPSRLFAGSFQG